MVNKTVIFSIILTNTIFLTAISAGTYSGGDGTSENPFQITTPNDLNSVGDNSGDWDKHFILTEDINMADYTYTTAVIAPDINDSNYSFHGSPFTGTFDGNGCNIINLTLDAGMSSSGYLGLFGYMNNAQVMDLGIIDINISSYHSYNLGGLCGYNNLGSIRFTEKGNCLYAIDLGNEWPTTLGFADYGDSERPKAPYTIPGVKPVKDSEIRMLGSSKDLP
jgi:hypothetical protein